ncbi:hypothetical protein CR152_00730 [Massilia violaceinigra]|uniref:Uncharacterized protein n=1 Tax=Massilia violaceinigra TaxID=2045208 RepID=A0A2D2DDY9_9BURK|nr:hypothetical protein CR152_00730 [Massilia violaceinigra]
MLGDRLADPDQALVRSQRRLEAVLQIFGKYRDVGQYGSMEEIGATIMAHRRMRPENALDKKMPF